MRRPGSFLLACCAGIGAAVLMQWAASWLGGWPAFDGRFLGPDSYMRLLRVRECSGVACPGGVFPRSNAPFGEVLHWPDLLDWLIIALATPLRPWLGWAESVTTAGYLVGPSLEVAAVVAVTMAARSIVDHPAWGFAGIFFATQLWVTWAFAPSRPDHHGLQALLFLVAVASTVRLMVSPQSRTAEAGLGLSVAGALWVSVEGLVTVTLPLAILALRWAWLGGRRWTEMNIRVYAWTTLVLASAIVLDGPKSGSLAVVYDRVSIAHVAMFLCATGVWGALRIAPEGRSIAARLAGMIGGMAVAAAVSSLAFPGLPHGPLADVDPRIIPIWLDQVSEYVPLLGRPSARALVEGLGPVALALPASVWAWSRARGGRAWAWALVAVCLIWFAVLGSVHGSRWSYYLQLLLPLPYCWLMGEVLGIARELRRPIAKAATQVVGAAILLLGFPLAIVLVAARVSVDTESAVGSTPACQAEELVRALPPSVLSETGSIILAPIGWGPEIMYHTQLDVVATPYHRNHSGIIASRDIMESTDEAELLDLLQRRGVRYLTSCRADPWSPLLTELEAISLFSRLMRNDPPAYLVPIPLLPGLGEQYGLWRVDPGAADPGLRQ